MNEDLFFESITPYLDEANANIAAYSAYMIDNTDEVGNIRKGTDLVQYLQALSRMNHYLGALYWTHSIITDNSPKWADRLMMVRIALEKYDAQRDLFSKALEQTL